MYRSWDSNISKLTSILCNNHSEFTEINLMKQQNLGAKSLYINSNIEVKNNFNLSIFTIPKPFIGHIGIIQRNAIKSWTLLQPKPEIILFGEEEGTQSLAQELNLHYIPNIKRNQYGTPLLNSIFAQAQSLAKNTILTYVNSDIILMQDFSLAVQQVSEQLDKFLMIGRRWNISLPSLYDFESPNWKNTLHQLVNQYGCLATHDAKDYFVFPKNLFLSIPEFAVGRGYWDTWMINSALDKGYPVVDASQVVMAIHQNHTYAHIQGGKNEAYMGKEAQHNQTIGNIYRQGTIANSTWQLKPWHFQHAPKISVIITAQNHSLTIQKTVASILEQKYSDYEIIVVDDGSDDHTQKLLQPYRNQIKYIYQNKQGVVKARNLGITMAQGEFITFLNAESFLLPEALAKQVARLEKESSTVDLLLSGWQPTKQKEFEEIKPWQDLPDLEDLHIWKLDKVWHPLLKSAVMFRRSRLQFIGGFNTKLDEQSAKIEAIITLVFLRGSRAIWLPESTYSHLSLSNNSQLKSIKNDNDRTKLIDSFFERSAIKEWMHLLKSRAYYMMSK